MARRLRNITQKLKGKAQQAVGEYHLSKGHVVKGGIAKAKGKINEGLADLKMRNDDFKPRKREDIFDEEDDDYVI